MRLVENELPNPNQNIIAYKSDGSLYFAVYRKVLTWKGNKFKFVNLMSKGFWDDDIVGWNNIPGRDKTI